jgi:histidinol phosphatase-like enzyme (inositol monophosphatase family)
VKQSSEITISYFNKISRSGITSSIKKDNTPVTTADLKCEDYLLKQICTKYPSHNILSEEKGVHENGSEFRWIIDPIDGTRNFMRGYPFWGTLLAVEFEGEIISGIISMPAIGVFICASAGNGCFVNGKKAKVSNKNKVEESYVLYTGLNHILLQSFSNNFLELASQCNYIRGFGDCHGHSYIISGMAEVLIDPIVAPYDIAATKICVEEAGGKLTDIHGIDSIYNRTAVISNGLVHDQVLKMLNEK